MEQAVIIRTLLDRDLFSVDLTRLYDHWTNRTIMVTGGGGSIGSELLRQLSGCHCRIVLFDRSENNIVKALASLKGKSATITPVLGSIRDENLLDITVRQYLPHVIIHAAAYKHVPLLETNVLPAVDNNVFGTQAVLRAATNYDIETFVMVSTDKAVAPASIMGCTKRIAEQIVKACAHPATHAIVVRLGNVLGSSGSVLPLFEKQIASGGPVTVSHPGATRFFMAPSEAAGLILHAALLGRRSQTLVLDMGQPINIDLMARKLIRLRGLEPDSGIQVTHTGMRPGEKLTEQLHTGELLPTDHPLIWIERPDPPTSAVDRVEWLDKLHISLAGGDEDQVLHAMKKLVPEYRNGAGKSACAE